MIIYRHRRDSVKGREQMKEKQKPLGVSHFFVYTVSFFLITLIISLSILYGIEKKVRTALLDEVMTHEEQTIALEIEILGHEFRMIIADLNYLTRVFGENMETRKHMDRLVRNWSEFSFQRGIYDQIRLIGADGHEQIRINLENGTVYATPEDQLQDKSDRYYFIETAKLGNGEIYISPLDLNIESGVIEVPYKPMVRFCTPLYNDSGDFLGVIVLNYLAKNLLNNFKEIAYNSYGEMVLLNSNGDWLSSSQTSREWNFMFEDRKEFNFSWYFPEWELVEQSTGQEITENGLFTFHSIDMSTKVVSETSSLTSGLNLADGSFHIVSYVLRDGKTSALFFDKFGPFIKDIFYGNIVLFISLLIIALLVGHLLYLYVKAYRKTKIYSLYDSLTAVLNRRAGTEALDKLLFQDERRKFSLSLCFIDINGLKQVNDVLGHEKGDELLITVVDTLKKAIREEDHIARMGGDEFIIIFKGIDTDIAETIWSRIYLLFDKINRDEDRPYLISVSHGIVSHDSSKGPITSDELIRQADAIMYEEKRRMKAGVDFIRGKK